MCNAAIRIDLLADEQQIAVRLQFGDLDDFLRPVGQRNDLGDRASWAGGTACGSVNSSAPGLLGRPPRLVQSLWTWRAPKKYRVAGAGGNRTGLRGDYAHGIVTRWLLVIGMLSCAPRSFRGAFFFMGVSCSFGLRFDEAAEARSAASHRRWRRAAVRRKRGSLPWGCGAPCRPDRTPTRRCASARKPPSSRARAADRPRAVPRR